MLQKYLVQFKVIEKNVYSLISMQRSYFEFRILNTIPK